MKPTTFAMGTLLVASGCSGGSASPTLTPPPSERATPPLATDHLDASTPDSTSSPTPPAPDCVVDESATAPPGVHFRFTHAKCTYSLKEVAAGIDFGYEIVIDADLSRLTCVDSSRVGSVRFLETVTDGKGITGLSSTCENVICPTGTSTVVLKAGTYPATYHWDGHSSYSGPADECTQGPLFPAGEYDLYIAEQWPSIADTDRRHIQGRLHLTIMP